MTLRDPESAPDMTPCDEHHKNLPEALQTRSYPDDDMATMTSERTQAYGRVVKTLEDLGPSKLQPVEQERIREAADNLIFAADLDQARAALIDVEELAEHLVATGRWTTERAEQLASDLIACGPVTPVA